MTMIWERSGEAFFGTVTELAGDVRFHLAVEFDGIRWDWAVWRPGEDRDAARHGATATRHGAMWQAERATEQ